MDTRKVSQEVQDKVLGQVRKGQETMAGALRAASRLPSRDELVSGAQDIAGQLLAAQRKASELLDTQRVTSDLQTIQRRATELLDSQRKLADRAIDTVVPLLTRAWTTASRPADAPARISSRNGHGSHNGHAAPSPAPASKAGTPKASTTRATTANAAAPKTAAPKTAAAGAPKASTTKASIKPATPKKSSTAKKTSSAKKKPGTTKPGTTGK